MMNERIPTVLIGVWLCSCLHVAAEEPSRGAIGSDRPGVAGGGCCESSGDAGAPGFIVEYVTSWESTARQGRPKRPRRIKFRPYSEMAVENGGTIEGVVTFEGTLPAARKIDIVKDHETCGKRETTVPVVRVNEKNQVAEAVVFLVDIREGKAFKKREQPPVIDQRDCTFAPHVQAVRVKEDVEIVNSDPVAHNIKADQRVYTLFNVLQPQQSMRSKQTFRKPGLVSLKCNVHDWMKAWLWVFPHPYHAVTGANGEFALRNVPPGKYKLAIWQEHVGATFLDIEVEAGVVVKLPITLKGDASKESESSDS